MRLSPSKRSCVALFVAAVALAGALRGGSPSAEEATIARLVGQLGDEAFARREQAVKALTTIGEPALPTLRSAAAASHDAEVRRRATQVSRAIMAAVCKSESIGLQLAIVGAGDFDMGAPQAEAGRRADEELHPVRIGTPFLLGVYEVTQEQYRHVMQGNPSAFAPDGAQRNKVFGQDTNRFPVEQVTWFEAIEFCNAVSRKDGLPEYYRLADVKREAGVIRGADVTTAGGNGYRLPTEAEWEYACRAGTTTAYHFGNATKNGTLNCKPLKIASGYGTSLKWPDVGRPTRVGTYPANGLGLYDMHGNVAEWCWDWYDRDYGRAPREDPRGPAAGTHRVQRGGSWLVTEASCRSAARAFSAPGERKDYMGFRVARTPGPAAK